MIDQASRPRIAAKARLRFDRRTDGYLLVAPERGLVLNRSASEILRLCTGDHTVAAIVAQLAAAHADAASRIEADVVALLRTLVARGLVEIAP